MWRKSPVQSRNGALPTSMGYGTLPNRRSAFTRLPGVAQSRWNTESLEQYAQQYEDLYSRRMNFGNKSGSNTSSSANTGSNSSNGYWFHNNR